MEHTKVQTGIEDIVHSSDSAEQQALHDHQSTTARRTNQKLSQIIT